MGSFLDVLCEQSPFNLGGLGQFKVDFFFVCLFCLFLKKEIFELITLPYDTMEILVTSYRESSVTKVWKAVQ